MSDLYNSLQEMSERIDTILAILKQPPPIRTPVSELSTSKCSSCNKTQPAANFKKGGRVLKSCYDCRAAFMAKKNNNQPNLLDES